MTAELLEFPAAEVRVRRGPTQRPASTRPVSTRSVAPHRDGARPLGPRHQAWGTPSARGCDVPQSARPASATAPVATRYEWTERGLAVMLGLIVTVVVLMTGTAVGAFLSVSDAPAATPAVAAVGAPLVPLDAATAATRG